ncbi:MAG TPA: sigma 54-interacting transcriptional regulator [Thermoanaerobaculia bacterium]|nr:sigma 54-interacting transcriptional regulator [Thermoanaerobaculia bacterium]
MPVPESPSPPSSELRLLAVAGPVEGKVFEIGGEPFPIGRQSGNRLQLHHGSVSRRHCVIEPSPRGVLLRDLESRCGTFVNGVPVRERLLEHGDFIKVGDVLFLFLSRPEESGETAALGDYTVRSTIQLSLDDVFYLHPERVQASLAAEDSKARALSTLLTISAEVQTLSGVEALARRLVERAFEAAPAERFAVLLTDGEDFSLVHASEEPPRVSRALIRRALEERVAVLGNDGTADGARSILCIPLVALGQPLGVLYGDSSRPPESFSPDHLELLSAMAGIASLALHNARRMEALEAENRRFRDAGLQHDIVGESPALQKVFQLVARVAPTDLTVLILGESGTGKELVAKALHKSSPRKEKPFVAINCATLSETLLESELFGHEKGSFTGAAGRKAGQFELAHEGTLFLDEVGEIPLPLQARLLRALETREIQRVGGARPIPVDVRLVAATNRDLAAAVRAGTFRDDLYHRLNVFALTLPPLRERREDIPLLASHFAARSARRLGRSPAGFSPEARAALLAYDWPGNIRELQNAVERAVVLAADDLLRPEDLPEAVLESAAAFESPSEASPGPYHEAVAQAKRRILLDALEQAGGNSSEAARRLGLNRTYFHRLLSHLKLRP